MGGGPLLSTLLYFMLSIAVLVNEVCSACSVSFLLFASSENTVWLCLVKMSSLFPFVEDPSWWCGDKRSLYPYVVPDIAQNEGSDGPLLDL